MEAFVAIGFAAVAIVACVGYGRSVEALIGGWDDAPPLSQLSTGNAGCVGAAVSLCAAGVLVAADLYSEWFGWLWLVVGCALALRSLAGSRRGWPGLETLGPLSAVIVVLGLQALYRAGWAIGNPYWNACDDLIAYVPFVDRLAETGGMIEPFSQRRIASLGGGSVFDSLFTTTLGFEGAQVADPVAGGLLVGLLLLPLSSKGTRLILGALLVVSFTFWQTVRSNLTPIYMPAALIAAMIMVLAETQRSRANLLDRRVVILIGFLGAGLLTLRVWFAVPVALFALVLIVRAAATLRERLHAGLVFSLALGLPVIPWMIALWRSSGTPLYPPISGNLDTAWPGFRDPGFDLLSKLGDVLATAQLAWMLAAIVLAGVALMALRRSAFWAEAPLLALPGAAITIAITLVSLSAFLDFDLARYVWPVLAGILIATLALLANEASPRLRQAHQAVAATIVVAVAVGMAIPTKSVRNDVSNAVTGTENLWSDNKPPEPGAANEEEYDAVQASLPEGASVATTSDYPYLFDYDRNDFVNLDILGGASPPPGMPLGAGTAAITDYLRGEGFEFVVATDPASSICLYNSNGWRSHLRHGTKPFASLSPYFLEWSRWLSDRAAVAPRLVSWRGSLIVLDLRVGA